MAERSSYEPGIPSWVDLSSQDPKASAAFYEQLFGWTADWDPRPEAGGYGQFKLRGRSVAGIGPTYGEGTPSVWNTYISTRDAAATTAEVRAQGGMVIMEPMQIFDSGVMAVFQDPAGAYFSVWQADQHPGAGLVNEPGALCWNELASRDTAAALRFYPSVFGWEARSSEMSTGGMQYTEWLVGGRSIAGMMEMPAEVPAEVPSYWLSYFAVPDCQRAVIEATRLGGTVFVPPTELPFGRFSVLGDPQSATFGVIDFSGEDQDVQ